MQHVPLAGHSIVVDPLGEIVAEAGSDQELLIAEIDPERVRDLRAEYPFRSDRQARHT